MNYPPPSGYAALAEGFACATLGGLGDEHSEWVIGEAPRLGESAPLACGLPSPGAAPGRSCNVQFLPKPPHQDPRRVFVASARRAAVLTAVRPIRKRLLLRRRLPAGMTPLGRGQPLAAGVLSGILGGYGRFVRTIHDALDREEVRQVLTNAADSDGLEIIVAEYPKG